ncbi:MAG: mobilization protein [Mucilaginibacter sp.]|nr:mobilization protein [Mucilaginibacter sp.]
MIGKLMTGKDFGGCLRYVLSKEKAVLLDACGIRTDGKRSIIQDFNTQRKLNPNLTIAVGHIALSWSMQDKGKLTPDLMAQRAKEYMIKMKINNTQYLIAQHRDKPHPHIHIVYNRVNNEGKTISDQFQKQRNVKVCKELTLLHGYYLSPGKESVNKGQLKGPDGVKYELYDTIRTVLKHAKNWPSLERMLSKDGIAIRYKYKGATSEIQGVSFSKNGMSFKGSQIDRSLSYGRIDQQIIFNQQKEFPQSREEVQNISPETEITETVYLEQESDHERIRQVVNGVMEEFLRPFRAAMDQDDDLLRKKRRKNERYGGYRR